MILCTWKWLIRRFWPCFVAKWAQLPKVFGYKINSSFELKESVLGTKSHWLYYQSSFPEIYPESQHWRMSLACVSIIWKCTNSIKSMNWLKLYWNVKMDFHFLTNYGKTTQPLSWHRHWTSCTTHKLQLALATLICVHCQCLAYTTRIFFIDCNSCYRK